MQPPHPAPVSLAPKAPLSLDKETKVSRPLEEHWDKKDDDCDDYDGYDDDGYDEDDESDLIMIFAGGMAGRHEVAQGGQSWRLARATHLKAFFFGIFQFQIVHYFI